MIVAATGHRELPCGTNRNSAWFIPKRAELHHYLYNNDSFRIRYCLSGMAQGWDLWFAEECLSLNIPVHAYIPFIGQEDNFDLYWKKLYRNTIKNCKVVVCAEKNYERAYLDRNDRMLEEASHVAAMLDPTVNRGGTYYTVNRAKEKNLKILNFWTNSFIT